MKWKVQLGSAVWVAIAVSLISIAGGTALFVWSGAYNVAASSQHTQPVYTLLEYAMTRSVRVRASSEKIVDQNGAALTGRGAACYRDNCEQCHGGPGVAPHSFALGMQPLPGPLIGATQRWDTRELYWLTRNGITMSGMPAWRYRLDDADLRAVVAFVEALSTLSASEYRTATSGQPQCMPRQGQRSAGDADRGRRALSQYGCNGCHIIPGVTGADVHVGPPLHDVGRRQLIAGQVPNTPENMVRWLLDPQAIDPRTAMPKLGIVEADAQDMAAYLQTLQ
jgi:mono/diheme cytochrome c family protein